MLTLEARLIYIDRIELVDRNLKPCNGGHEIHIVGNLRNIVVLLRVLIEADDADDGKIKSMVDRLEKKQLEFFQRKFSYLTDGSK